MVDSAPVPGSRAGSAIPRISGLNAEERKSVERLLKSPNQLAQTLQEVAFTNKWCKKDKPYSGVWLARGTGYPIVGRFFIKQIGLDKVEGFVEQESRAKIFGKCNKDWFDLNVQWSNGDLTHVGVAYNPESKDAKQLQGRMNPIRTSLKFPYVHYRLIPGTSEYDEDFGNKGSLNKYVIDAKAKDLYDKLLNNIYAVSELYECISFKRLADLFSMDVKSAESLAQCLLKCGQVTGAVDQEDQMVIFQKQKEALKKFNAQVREICVLVQGAYDAILKEHPSRKKRSKKYKKSGGSSSKREKAAAAAAGTNNAGPGPTEKNRGGNSSSNGATSNAKNGCNASNVDDNKGKNNAKKEMMETE
mmetsp:Transcript_10066/g.18314  ORF Transcript_10066/g.18314 Transcript_10066/m.18314 type:complete len:359 (-) Transcript_10066:108-1184(-)